MRVEGLVYDEDKIGRHGITSDQLDQVLARGFRLVRNRKGRRMRYVLIGQDFGGACIAVPIEQTDEPGIWRRVTAWYCKASEWAKLP